MEKINVTRASLPEMSEYFNEIKDIWDTHWLTNMGEKHRKFENLLAEFMGISVDNIALFVNGHQALECILEAMDLGFECNSWGESKNEVITSPYTFASTTHALVRKGLKPVFCDIKQDDFTIDATKIEQLITDRTCAILPIHVYGNVCDVHLIEKIAEKYDLKVVYDAAHAFGVQKYGKNVAEFGDATMFSFHATKVFNSIEGGAVCFKNKQLKPRVNQWKNFGILGPEDVEFVGGNAKMNEFCAAMGICNLRHLEEDISKRKEIDNCYRKYLSRIEGVTLCDFNNEKNNYSYFPIIIDETKVGTTRDDIYEKLKDYGIYARKYFYPITSAYNCYLGKFDVNDTPIANQFSKRVLTLPIYPTLKGEDVDNICKIILECIDCTLV